MPTRIVETATITPPGVGRRWRARIIEGDRWGSSGYYPREVLERDGPVAWPEGTHMFFDHPGGFEDSDRPERSVRDLAGRVASTPVYEGDGLYADVELYSWAADLVREMADDIGLSIRAYATVESGDVGGRRGPVVRELTGGISVDLVTKAGAGGRFVELLESHRPMVEALIDQTREQLSSLVSKTNKRYTHILDVDPENRFLVYATTSETDERSLYKQGYTFDTNDVPQLVGDPTLVTRRVEYVPAASLNVPAPAGRTPQESQEGDTMPEISEAKLAELAEAAGRVETLETTVSQLTERLNLSDQVTRRVVQDANTQVAEAIVDATDTSDLFTPLERRALLADLPLREDGRLDGDSLREAAKTALAEAEQRSGAGRVRGFGKSTTVGETLTEADFETQLARIAGRGEEN